MSLKRSNSSISLKRSGSAPNLINTTDEFRPYKRDSSIYYDDDDDDDWGDEWETPPNVVYKKSNINRTPINPIKAYTRAMRGHAGIIEELRKIGNAFGPFFPRRKRTGRRSKKKKKKNNRKTKKKKQGKKKQSSRKKKKKKYKKQGKKNKRKTKRR